MSVATEFEQAVVLCGGLGSRLGSLTATTPKPLLPVAGKPFLERLLFEIKRHGIGRILLLAAHRSADIRDFAREASTRLKVDIDVAVEPDSAGTGGALWHAKDRLEQRFFLFNGDSWFDFNLLDLPQRGTAANLITIALRRTVDASRYGVAECEGANVRQFGTAASHSGPALVNAGVYAVHKPIVEYLRPNCSLERDVLEPLARRGYVGGGVYDGFFIDIGTPGDYERAQTDIPARQERGAVFLDRDGVINEDYGHVGSIERFDWRPGIKTAIKSINDSGRFVFVVSNQGGVAHGLYTEENVRRINDHIRLGLAEIGAHIDDFRHCPFHPKASIPSYARASEWRKPAPGMLLDLMKHWPVDSARSIMVGDRESDVEAAERACLRGYLLRPGERLADILTRVFTDLRVEVAE